MNSYLVVTKDKKYLVEADDFGEFDVMDKRRCLYKFLADRECEVALVAVFDRREVKAIMDV